MHLFKLFIRKCDSIVTVRQNFHFLWLRLYIRAVLLFCFFLQDISHNVCLSRGYYRTTRFDNARLRPGNLLQRISNHTKMIDADGCKCCTDGILHNIRRVRLTAKSGLKYDHVAMHFPKIQKSHCRLCFK